MADISIFILTMKRSELKILIEEILKEVRLSQKAIDMRHRIQPKEKKCTNCGEPSQYNLNGNWVCQKCYPYNKWNTPESEEMRQKRNRRWMLKQIRSMTGSIKESIKGLKPELWVQGHFFKDEGYANYALLNNRWYSVNGGPDRVEEVRWEVKDPKKIQLLMQMSGRLNEKSSEVNRISNNQVYNGKTSIGGYSHGATYDYGDVPLERDPLNDPLLTGKKPFLETNIREKVVKWGKYTFTIFGGDAKAGFDYPIDVKYGTIYLGELRAMPDGYVVRMIETPSHEQRFVSFNKENMPPYKSMLDAVKVLHQMWASYRKNT